MNQQPPFDPVAPLRDFARLHPADPAAHARLAAALRQIRRMDEAVDACRKVVQLLPDSPEAHLELGVTLRFATRMDDAIAEMREAIRLRPDFAQAFNSLANTLSDSGNPTESLEAYRRALAIQPDFAACHSNMIYSLHFHPDFDYAQIAKEQKVFSDRFEAPLAKFIKPHDNDRSSARPLRIGYVSPDFCHQAESHFTYPLFKAHNREQFQIHCYASVARPDQITQRLRSVIVGGGNGFWHEVFSFSDDALADRIRADKIDILVDLTMHMARNRLGVFARKPAPVQCAWLAYPGSTGLRAMDWRLTDSHMDPPGPPAPFDEFYSEASHRLPDCWVAYDPLIELPVASERPPGPLRFGSFNNPCKLNNVTLNLWANVLEAIPESRLLLLVHSMDQRLAIQKLFTSRGLADSRIEFTGRQTRADYLRLYNKVDICLDTLPYNGITTTCDALWMGVPVISLQGRTAASRAGLSILHTIGHLEWSAATEADLITRCQRCADDLPALNAHRAILRKQMESSPLMNAPRFAGNVEAAYQMMWHKWLTARP